MSAPIDNTILENNIKKLDLKIEDLTSLVKILLTTITKQPSFTTLSLLAKELNKSRSTIRHHLLNNYEPEKDFKQENGSIRIDSAIVPLIKDYYEKKQGV